MRPRLPYTSPVVLLVVLALLSCSLPVHAARDPNVQESLKRIRHGPVLPTGFQDHHKRWPRDDVDYRANADHDEPLGLDPQRSRHDPNTLLAAERRDAPVPEYTPIVTPAPDQEAVLASQGYKQLTFYSCNTIAGSEHCGWHVPVVKAQAVTSRRDSGTVWMVVACLAGVFALGLM
jgi:hypothetical protein